MHYACSVVLLAALQSFAQVSGSPVAQIASSPVATVLPTITVRIGRCLTINSLTSTSSSGSVGGPAVSQSPTSGSNSIGGSTAGQTGTTTLSTTQSANYGSISGANGFGQPNTTSSFALTPSASILGASSYYGTATRSTTSGSSGLVASSKSTSSLSGSSSSSGTVPAGSATSTSTLQGSTAISSGSTTNSPSSTTLSAIVRSTSTTSGSSTTSATSSTVPTVSSSTSTTAASTTVASTTVASSSSSSEASSSTPATTATSSSTTSLSTTASSTTDPRQPILANPTAIITQPDASMFYQGDDASGSVQLPFPMRLFSQTSSNIFVSSNGLLSFDTGSTSYANAPLPQSTLPAMTLAAYWEDLIVEGGTQDGVFYQVDNSGTTPSVTFEYILANLGIQDEYYHFLVNYQSDNPGVIKVYYFATPDSGAGATIGIQGSQLTGQQAISYSNAGSPAIAPGQVVTFNTNLGTSSMSPFNIACYAPGTWPKSSC